MKVEERPPSAAAGNGRAVEGLTLMRADTTGVRTDTVRRLLGRAPRTFTAWCTRNAQAFSDN